MRHSRQTVNQRNTKALNPSLEFGAQCHAATLLEFRNVQNIEDHTESRQLGLSALVLHPLFLKLLVDDADHPLDRTFPGRPWQHIRTAEIRSYRKIF